MIIQQINRDDPDKVWVTIINRQGATLTSHWPVSKFGGTGNVASVGTAEVALPNRAVGNETKTEAGTFVGVMDEDLSNNNTGLAQVYGYHASVLCGALNAISITIAPGVPIAPMHGATVGFNSVKTDNYGPVIVLDTLVSEFTLNVAGSAASYGDHVFIRAL